MDSMRRQGDFIMNMTPRERLRECVESWKHPDRGARPSMLRIIEAAEAVLAEPQPDGAAMLRELRVRLGNIPATLIRDGSIAVTRASVSECIDELLSRAPKADRGESAWLIEHTTDAKWVSNDPPYHPGCRWYWGTANQAIRFSRQEDAYRASLLLGLKPSDCKITEHLWCDNQGSDELLARAPKAEPDDEVRRLEMQWLDLHQENVRLRAQLEHATDRLRMPCQGCPGCATSDCPDARDIAFELRAKLDESHKTIVCLEAENEAVRLKLDAVREAAEPFNRPMDMNLCDCLHHTKADRHADGVPCPIMVRLYDAIRDALGLGRR